MYLRTGTGTGAGIGAGTGAGTAAGAVYSVQCTAAGTVYSVQCTGHLYAHPQLATKVEISHTLGNVVLITFLKPLCWEMLFS